MLRSEHEAFDKIRHGDERDAAVAGPADDMQARSSDRPEYLVHPTVSRAEHDAGPHHRDGQRIGVPHGHLLTGELAAPVVRDRHRRIALDGRPFLRGSRRRER